MVETIDKDAKKYDTHHIIIKNEKCYYFGYIFKNHTLF